MVKATMRGSPMSIRLRPVSVTEARSLKEALARGGPKVVPEAGPEHDGEDHQASKSKGIEFGIEADGRLVGLVQTYSPGDRALEPGTFEIGIGIPDDSLRGLGIGTEALRLFTDWLRGHLGATRIQAVTALDNYAMRRSLAKLGFVPTDEITVGELKETLFVLASSS